MPAPALMTVALLLWSAGAAVYTIQLWKARGLTDNGFLGLGALILGSVAMAISLWEIPTLAVCSLFPAYFAIAITVTKVRAMIRVRWRRPVPEMPAMLPKVPPTTMADEVYDGTALTMHDWLASQMRAESEPEDQARVEQQAPLMRGEDEQERAKRIGRMFG